MIFPVESEHIHRFILSSLQMQVTYGIQFHDPNSSITAPLSMQTLEVDDLSRNTRIGHREDTVGVFLTPPLIGRRTGVKKQYLAAPFA